MKWSREESFPPFDLSCYWRAGLDALFGREATAKATAAVRNVQDFELEIQPDTLNCGCEISVIDVDTNTYTKITLALNLVEVALLHEFALIDPDLTHDLGAPYGRTNLLIIGLIPDQLKSNSAYLAKRVLVKDIVWGSNLSKPRRWEREDFMGRRD